MRALIDTCIIIDVIREREPFFGPSLQVSQAVSDRKAVGYLTAKSVTDIYYLTRQHTHSDQVTRQYLHKLFSLFEVLDTAGTDCRRALYSAMSDYKDAVMVESALRAGLDCIVTRNLKDYIHTPLPVYSPAEFLAILEKDQT